jgi:hypothetical protein
VWWWTGGYRRFLPLLPLPQKVDLIPALIFLIFAYCSRWLAHDYLSLQRAPCST